MAMPGHYCVLTSSDKVNEESTSGRMVGETKNGRAPSFERARLLWTSAQTCPTLDFSSDPAYLHHIDLSSYCSKTFGMMGLVASTTFSSIYITRPSGMFVCYTSRYLNRLFPPNR